MYPFALEDETTLLTERIYSPSGLLAIAVQQTVGLDFAKASGTDG